MAAYQLSREARDLDDVACVRRVDELAAADVDPDVAEAVEEDEVARLELVARDGDAVAVLGGRVVRQRDAHCAKTYMTKPEQSNPPGAEPPHTYGVPRYCIAIPTTPEKREGGAIAMLEGRLDRRRRRRYPV